MKARLLKKLHERQVTVLEMIIDCDERNASKEWDLKHYAKEMPSTYYIDWLKERISRNTAIKQRLISYYKDIQIRIMTFQPEIELTTSTEMDLSTTLS